MLIRLTRPLALRFVSLVVLSVAGTAACAVGLGQLQMQSSLGQPLRATVPVLGSDGSAVSTFCIKAKLELFDGTFLTRPQVGITRSNQSTAITIFTQQPMNEPAMGISVTVDCGTPVHRSYQVLLDPPVPGYILSPTIMPGFEARLDQSSSRSSQDKSSQNTGEAGTAKKSGKARRMQTAANDSTNPRESSDQAKRASAVNAAKASRAVLKLSRADEPASDYGLKLTTTMSEAAAESAAQITEELRLARIRFAALLRNEDPLQSARTQARSASEQAQILQAELAVLKDQGKINKARLAELETNSYSTTWIAGLGGLLLICLGAIIWLARRLHLTQKEDKSTWWEKENSIDGNTHDLRDSVTLDAPTIPLPLKPAKIATRANKPRQQIEPVFSEKRLEKREKDKNVKSLSSKSNNSKNIFPVSELTADTISPSLAKLEMVKVEEISDVLQEAEFWMLLNDHARVLEILEPLSIGDHPDSPVPWLYLLDTYRAVGDQAKYEALGERFERLFNAHLSAWEASETEEALLSLDEFPHLVDQICEMWGGNRVVPYLESLLIDNRDGTRSGFALPVYRDIMMLITVAKELEKSKLLQPAPFKARAR